MEKRNEMATQTPGFALAGFLIMQVGIVLVLVAQSLSTTSKAVVFWSGMLLLLLGVVLFFIKLASLEQDWSSMESE